VEGESGVRAEAAHQLLQLPDEVRSHHFRPGSFNLHDEMLHELTYTMAAFVDDLDFGFKIAQRATEYGVDGFSMPQAMAFGFELKEAGILTDADFAGCPSDNEGKFYWMLDRIVRREGIGDVLANGTYWAAKQIGKGAQAYAHNVIKKHEQLPLKLGMLNPIYFLMYCTGEKMNITQIEGNFPQAPFSTMELKEAFVKDWVQAPNDSSEIRSGLGIPRGTLNAILSPVEACAKLSTGRRRCTTSTTPSGCAPGCRPFP